MRSSKEHNFEEIVGNSRALVEVLHDVETVAPTLSTVLITGETGCGKELIARAIHSRSARKNRPLVKLNCGAIPTGLVESELFGHMKGAFTGALERRVGRFELADGGTLFLDEISELPLDTQVKLLRVLQEREFEPLGSSRTIRVDVRIIAASNRDLDKAIHEGRRDLLPLSAEAATIDEAVVSSATQSPMDPSHSLEQVEKRHILEVLTQTKWVIEGAHGAAKVLDLHPNTLRSRMKKLGLERSSTKASSLAELS